jgi:predicted porin
VKQMKLVLAMFIALAMATPALAFNVEWHGDFNNRFSYSTQADLSRRLSSDTDVYYAIDGNRNFPPSGINFHKNKNDAGFFGEVKYRTELMASDDEKKVLGVLGFEFGSLKYGSQIDLGGDEKNTLELRWAYTDIELPFDPASRISVGLQPVGYNGFIWNDNAPGVKWYRTDGHWKYSLSWWRTNWNPDPGKSGAADSNRNGEIYATDITYIADNGASINGFVIWRDQGDKSNDNDSVTDVPNVNVLRDNEIWLGLSGQASWGNLSALATGIYLTGEVRTDSTTEELDRSAYLLQAQFDYKMDKFTFSLGGLYASGDDDPNDGDLENFDHIDISTSLLGSVCIFDNYADDNSISQAFYLWDQGYKILYGGVKYALNDKTDVWGKYFWHNTAEDDLLGDDEIGHEFVVGVGYKPMKGLSLDINAGYLIAGDALDAPLVTGGTGDADDIFRTDARIRFKF